MEPTLRDYFIYKNQRVDLEWFDVVGKDQIPDLPWKQAYVVCEIDGLVALVFYEDGHFGLPGGHLEDGESLDEVFTREIKEELNCELEQWWPLGYQVMTNKKYGTVYQFRAYAKVKKVGQFVDDIGGGVRGYKLVPLEKVNDFLGYKKVGDHLVEIAQRLKDSL